MSSDVKGRGAALAKDRYRSGDVVPPIWNDTLEVLFAHRSVRAYLPQALPDGTLETLVAAAQSASTSSNLQAWSVVAIEEPERKARLAELCGNQGHIVRAPLFLVWLIDLARLSALAQAQAKPSEALDYVETFLLGAVDAALAAQNAMTAMESLGLGGVYIGGIRNKPEAVAAELNLPPQVFPLMGLCVGVPDPARPASVKPRLPQASVLFREQYDWGATQKAGAADYDQHIRAFQREQGMGEADWTAQAVSRVRDAGTMSGRHVLREVLERMGFPLR